MGDAGTLADDYRRIDALLEARARDYPRRVEPTWSDLLGAIDALSARLLAWAQHEPSDFGEFPSYYDSPVFVVGHRKTGTTLLLDLLDGHPQLVALPGESNHFLTFLPRFGGLPADRIAAEAQRWWMLRLISPSGIAPFWALGQPALPAADPYALFSRRLIELADGNPERDVLGLAAAALHAAGGGVGEPRAWVEKTPGQEHELDAILARYSAARFVQLVRDPRSVAAAIARLDRATGQEMDLVDVGLTMRRSFDAAERNVRRLGEDRYLVLRYEDLVAEPEPTMRRIASFVGIDWADSLLTPTVGGVEATSNSAWVERKATGRIESGGLELWRRELDERSAEIVSAATRPVAKRFGYELPRAGVHALAEVTARRARAELGRRRNTGR
jgi:Sulfotransferase family